jgi:hypothetical protein
MTLQFICAEIERLRLQIRRQQKEVFTLQRSGIGAASAELLLRGSELLWMRCV